MTTSSASSVLAARYLKHKEHRLREVRERGHKGSGGGSGPGLINWGQSYVLSSLAERVLLGQHRVEVLDYTESYQ